MILVNAEILKQSIVNEMLKAEINSPVFLTLECVITDIENQPTAFDPDKVIEQIEELGREHPYKQHGEPYSYGSYNEAWTDCIDRVIDIIEKEVRRT